MGILAKKTINPALQVLEGTFDDTESLVFLKQGRGRDCDRYTMFYE